MRLTFLGAAGEVTGSCYLVDIVFAGFQAANTLGRRIVDGANTVRMFGEAFPVRAKVFTIGGLSAHADRSALLGWLAAFRRPPEKTWVVHGEPLAAFSLRDALLETTIPLT